MVETHLAKDRGLQITDVLRVLYCPITEFIGAPVNGASFDAASRQPGSEPFWIMVAPGGVL